MGLWVYKLLVFKGIMFHLKSRVYSKKFKFIIPFVLRIFPLLTLNLSTYPLNNVSTYKLIN